MANPVPARLSTTEGRKFGLQVGGALMLLGAIAWWRGRAAAPVLATVGALLVVAGALVPARLHPVYRAWMRLAHAMSAVTTPVFMGLIYFAVVTPVGAFMRAMGRDPLRRSRDGDTDWVPRVPRTPESDSMERQF